ncbi:MAG: NAD(P)/FAD-dependent oxidoreductase [Acidimicrobiales bacterium]
MVSASLEQRYRERSLWLDGIPASLAPRPSLEGDAAFDVAIVGAGFTGLWTAYYLKRLAPDARVVVLEREIAGFGPSGRNGGWVSGGMAGSWNVYARSHGSDTVGRAERETNRTVDEIGGVVERERIECGFQKDGTLALATTGPQAVRLRDELTAARRHGIAEEDLRTLDPDELATFVHVPGSRFNVYSPHCARVDPARLVRGLAEACERAGVVILERTEAIEVGPRRVRCRQGVVSADHVLRTTESYTTQLPGEKLRYLPLYSLMIATEPLSPETWGELGWREGLTIRDERYLFFYAQRTVDGRIAIGGRGAPYHLDKPIDETAERDPRVGGRLRATIRKHFPAAADAAITHRWGGPLAVPRDWCMSVHYDRATGFGTAGGYTGHGVAAANLSGRTLADLVLGRDSDLVTLPWVGHRSRRWEPEPLRYIASQVIVHVLGAADRYEDRTDRTARRAALVSPFTASP